ncbi:hypothetical protein Hamer_G002007 [Homarus americanus]|uniref:Uncharacterized protein n=1 Tax=Homarus americanus TaxID=6706 RepID=A0A8J5JRN4_HOMAM|nr:hypothetical protein Hamer_G002007 [Homarus americanus]
MSRLVVNHLTLIQENLNVCIPESESEHLNSNMWVLNPFSDDGVNHSGVLLEFQTYYSENAALWIFQNRTLRVILLTTSVASTTILRVILLTTRVVGTTALRVILSTTSVAGITALRVILLTTRVVGTTALRVILSTTSVAGITALRVILLTTRVVGTTALRVILLTTNVAGITALRVILLTTRVVGTTALRVILSTTSVAGITALRVILLTTSVAGITALRVILLTTRMAGTTTLSAILLTTCVAARFSFDFAPYWLWQHPLPTVGCVHHDAVRRKIACISVDIAQRDRSRQERAKRTSHLLVLWSTEQWKTTTLSTLPLCCQPLKTSAPYTDTEITLHSPSLPYGSV